jgi:hypothetical protein
LNITISYFSPFIPWTSLLLFPLHSLNITTFSPFFPWTSLLLLFPLLSLSIMLYSSKTCSIYRTILVLLSNEGTKLCIFIHEFTSPVCESVKCEPTKGEGWVYSCFDRQKFLKMLSQDS